MNLHTLDPTQSTPLDSPTCRASANFKTFTRWFPSWKASRRWARKQEEAFAAEHRRVLHTTEFGRLQRPRRSVITTHAKLVRIGYKRSNSRTTGKAGIRVQFQPVVVRVLADAMVGPQPIVMRKITAIYGNDFRRSGSFWESRPNRKS